ncbi:MAG: DUF4112 domain-containing protein [Balneolaceae bacterium]|nr:DUF4112 domain-containing protein [Balneolaceae bacterium]
MSDPLVDREKRERFAELLDSRYRIPGTEIRIGIDPLIGLVPGVGDWIGGVVSLYFLFQAALLGGRSAVLGRMFINILLDVLIGSVPIVGEIFDVYWKANEQNAEILREIERDPEKTTSDSRFWLWSVFVQLVALVLAILLLIGWLITELLGLLF